jgi:ElaB/YqjD/DUF883 family membrane-anchored ribosome-binding protein
MADSEPSDKSTSSGEQDVQSSLSRALETLEEILERRGGRSQRRRPAQPARSGAELLPQRQYTIPLLNEVVVPGTGDEAAPEPAAAEERPSITEDEECRRAIQRLASELEVIIQTGVEEAVREATRAILERVRNHLDIMLPEVLEEIAEARARWDRPDS